MYSTKKLILCNILPVMEVLGIYIYIYIYVDISMETTKVSQ